MWEWPQDEASYYTWYVHIYFTQPKGALTVIILHIDDCCFVRFNVYDVALIPSGGHCTHFQSDHLKLLQGNIIISELQWQELTRVVTDVEKSLRKVEGLLPSHIVEMVGYIQDRVIVASMITVKFWPAVEMIHNHWIGYCVDLFADLFMHSLSLTSKVIEFCILQLVMTGNDWDTCRPLSE